jgi:hypothetical protein
MGRRHGGSHVLAMLVVAACGGVKGGSGGAADSGTPDSGMVDGGGGAADARPADAALATAPAVVSVSPDWGSTAGGTRVAIEGGGFTTAGLTVTFDGDAAAVTVIDDQHLIAIAPPGPHEAVALEVVNDLGSASGGDYRYLAPLYAADGRTGAAGSLYMIDPANGAATPIGPIGVAITGLALSPSGVMYGVANMPQLLVVDPYTGAGTPVAALTGGTGTILPHDITFAGERLLGWQVQMLEIDPASGAVTQYAAVPGDGFAIATDGTAVLATAANAALSTVDIGDGSVSAGPTLTGPMNSVNALTFAGTTLLGSVATPASGLYRIDMATGGMTFLGELPAGIDALVGIAEQESSTSASRAAALALAAAPGRAPPAACPGLAVRAAGSSLGVASLLALPGRDVDEGGRARRLIPLASLRRFSAGAATAELVACGGRRAVVPLDAPGLALTPNRRGAIKLVDQQAGFRAVLGDVVEIWLR